MHSDTSATPAVAYSTDPERSAQPTIGTVDSVIERLRASASARTAEPQDPFDRVHRVCDLLDLVDAELVAVARDMTADANDPEIADFQNRLRSVRITLAIAGLDFADFKDYATYGLNPDGEAARRFYWGAS
jgi:hypothetical protein